MSYSSPILLIHILGGTLGLLTGTAAMLFRTGSPQHILAGRVFVVSMLTMATGAAYLGVVRSQPGNVTGGIFTFYLVATAWLTARRGDKQTSRFDWVALLIPLAVGIYTWRGGILVLLSGRTSFEGVPVGMMFFMGSICLLAATGDVRMLLRGGISGTRRIARHLWRMCYGLFTAAGSFFLGPSNRPLRLLSAIGLGKHLPQGLLSIGPYLVLTILPLVMLIFWLVRIRFRNAYRGQPQGSSA